MLKKAILALLNAQGAISRFIMNGHHPIMLMHQFLQCFINLNNGGLSKNKRILAQEQQKAIKKSQTLSKTKTLLGSMKKSKYEDAINEDIDPTVCLNIRLVGHSFPPGS